MIRRLILVALFAFLFYVLFLMSEDSRRVYPNGEGDTTVVIFDG